MLMWQGLIITILENRNLNPYCILNLKNQPLFIHLPQILTVHPSGAKAVLCSRVCGSYIYLSKLYSCYISLEFSRIIQKIKPIPTELTLLVPWHPGYFLVRLLFLDRNRCHHEDEILYVRLLHCQHLLVLYEYCKFSENFQSKRQKIIRNTKIAICLENPRPHEPQFLFLLNHKIAQVVRDVWRLLSPTSTPKAESNGAGFQGSLQLGLEYFQRWKLKKPLWVTCLFCFIRQHYWQQRLIHNQHKLSYQT